jgi:hypothetical protein
VHCSRVFRSSAPSDLLPSSPGGRRQEPPRVNAAALDQWNGGSAPVQECRTEGCRPAGKSPARHIPGRHVAGAGPLSGEGRTTRDPELAARAQRAATRTADPAATRTADPSSSPRGRPARTSRQAARDAAVAVEPSPAIT